jgi:hypothetical protein
LDAEHKKTSARVFDSSTRCVDVVVGEFGSQLGAIVVTFGPTLDAVASKRFCETLDAIAAELRSNVDTIATTRAMTPDAKEFFFLAAVFIAAIVAHIASRCSTSFGRTGR